MKRVKNPLRKRILRELAGDWRKYLLVSLFLILTIGFVSGMYVANNSMLTSAEKSISQYRQEDGHFELREKADEDLLEKLQSGKLEDAQQYGLEDEELLETPVRIYENFFRNETADDDCDGTADGTIRIYARNDKINQASLLEGRLPENEQEIAIDRMHADNVQLQIGDQIQAGNERYKIVGLIAYVNYSTLHEKNTDLMFDALKFDVGMVTEQGFARLNSDLHYAYAWQYETAPTDEKEEKTVSENLMKQWAVYARLDGNELKDFLPRYANQAINFATDDMGSDKAMCGVLLDILIVIIAFIFAVTISNTITKEASAIGTLRASGYTRGELIRHFLMLPLIVTVFAAIVGNVLGYTVFKDFVVSMYYNSYSLPAYETVWNMEAFWKTTVIPFVLMFIVNLAVIVRMLQYTPLQFLRHDLKKKKRKKAMRLPKWRFFNRFRLRIIFQNIPDYLILFTGIFFIMVMLSMAVGMPSTLSYYQKKAPDMMLADYQYILKSWKDENGRLVQTAQEDAEPFAMCSLLRRSEQIDEEISVYGVAEDSRYVDLTQLTAQKEKAAGGSSERKVCVSEPFAEKYDLTEGETLLLEAKYEDCQYTFTIAGIYDQCQTLAVFLPIDQYRSVFDLEKEAFTGYFSNQGITDISDEQIATVITQRDITKMCDQLDHSMGSYMTYLQYLCIALSAVMIYLLTKLIIEKNEKAISMTKILGYDDREIAGLYLFATTAVVILADAVSVVLGTIVMRAAWKLILFSYSGWFAFVIEPVGYAKMFLFVLIGYLIVLFFDFRRIRRISLEQALKNVE